jgi:hypothetical protein
MVVRLSQLANACLPAYELQIILLFFTSLVELLGIFGFFFPCFPVAEEDHAIMAEGSSVLFIFEHAQHTDAGRTAETQFPLFTSKMPLFPSTHGRVIVNR